MSAVLSLPPRARPVLRPAALRIGTRGSALALRQARMVIAGLGMTIQSLGPFLGPSLTLREHVVSTSGDRVQDRYLADIGGKGLFAKELHEALLHGYVDVAVHSLKDLEAELPRNLTIACMLPREEPRDALVIAPSIPVMESALPFPMLPLGARIGTASARRQAQLLHARPDLRVALIRGNIGTRLARLDSGDFAATLLALAGLKRLGLAARADVVLEPEAMLPAAGQGIIAVIARTSDHRTLALLAALDDPEARTVATAERAVLRALDGSCRTPIGAYARLLGGELLLTAMVARADGSFLLGRSLLGRAADAARLGAELGASLRADSPSDIFA